MTISSRRIRPLLTFAFIFVGAYAGYALAKETALFLDNYFLSGGKGTTPKFLGLIPINPTQLSSPEKVCLFAVLIVVGLSLGFIIEQIAFSQAKRFRSRIEGMAPHDKIAASVGLAMGLFITALLTSIFKTDWTINIVAAVVLCYTSVIAAESFKEQIRFYSPGYMHTPKSELKIDNRPKILDTNVIIDGRISDVCKAGFIEGPIFVPKFILEELQQIADSSDSLKRARGRRGLDILNQMQKEMDLQVPDFAADSSTDEVDSRLVLVARDINGAIITNDYNLNRVAELQGVTVLNINELANALKPVVLPGEEMQVTVIKEGKEKDQGIAYLDDGTMIVVEGARRMIGETMGVTVTSVLQTVQGKMIFGRIRDGVDQESDSIEENIRSYTGGRPRRKIR